MHKRLERGGAEKYDGGAADDITDASVRRVIYRAELVKTKA